ncbi:hypothetical protein RchiOBHm_Chr7g0231661 [Rosa chinensis]|uniref:Uncharacterized protein n=1 Tax=Rosa chinensis TaxID=74649 RepID=A0A2P6PFQ5_ROSCH|nr:hypothetical protein RchiOBHm_Chr7g0231661 [Rosa chinensis]
MLTFVTSVSSQGSVISNGRKGSADRNFNNERGWKAQSELDMCAKGLEMNNLSRLMGSEAVNYTCVEWRSCMRRCL